MNLRNLVSNWTSGRFMLESGYYSGRPPSESDLNSEMLEGIYAGMKAEFGEHVASNFVRFVAKLRDLSASSFIVAFERFARNGWKEINITQLKGDRTELSAHGDALYGQAMGLLGMMLGNQVGEAEISSRSRAIKSKFVSKHMSELPEDERKAALS